MSCCPYDNGEVYFFNSIKDKINVIFDVGCRTDSIYINFKGTVHYFDPEPRFIKKIRTIKNNNSECYFNNVGLSDSEENLIYHRNCQSFIDRRRDNKKMLMYQKAEEIKAKLIKGENYLTFNNIDIVDFLKIDVEGFELKVIKGFGELIRNIKIIQFEYGNDVNHSLRLKDIVEYLEKHNFYNFKILSEKELIDYNGKEPPFSNIVCFNKKYNSYDLIK